MPIVLLAVLVLLGIAAAPPLAAEVWWAALAALLVVGRLRGGHRVVMPPAALVLGGLIANSVPRGPLLRGPVAVQGRVVAAPMGRQADVAVQACATNGAPFLPCTGRVRVAFQEPPTPGSRWVVRGMAAPPRSDGLGGPDPSAALRRSGIRTVLWSRAERPLDGVPPRPAPFDGPRGLLASLATGDRRGVDAETWRILRQTGTAHLLAISGFHVGVVALVAGGLARFLLRLAAFARPAGMPDALAWWAGAVAAVLYAVSAGAPISAQRAAGMVVLAAIARSLHRRVDPARILLVVGVVVLAVDPAALVTPGFQLSFGAVVGLLRFGGPLQRCLAWSGWIGRGLAASTAATLGTLPAACWWFQAFAPSSPLANLIAIPWVTFGIAPFAAAWVYAPAPVAAIAGRIGSASVRTWLAVLDGLATAPWTPAVTASGALFLCLLVVRAHPRWVLSVLVLGLGLGWRPHGALEVWFLDVGQGDAAIVHGAAGERWMVDAGRSPRVVQALRRWGIRRLDAVVVSHGDADHAGGVPAVLCALDVGAVHIGRRSGHEDVIAAASRCGVPVIEHGLSEDAPANRASLVVRARSRHGDVLFTGDVDAAAEEALRDPATVLKVPHHGASTSSSPRLLDRVAPALAVVPVGRDNRYGHPHAEVLQRYAERSIPVVRTDELGSIRVRLEPEGVRYGAIGPLTPFSRAERAPKKNTAIANTTSARLIP
jgi:competence protein ComEC